jgi:galactokinase
MLLHNDDMDRDFRVTVPPTEELLSIACSWSGFGSDGCGPVFSVDIHTPN